MFNRILLCYDATERGRRALKRGAELAIQVGAEVRVLSVVPSDAVSPAVLAGALGHICVIDDERAPRDLLEESIRWLKARGVEASGSLVYGDTIREIANCARKFNIDLIVIGHYPTPTGRRWWSGSDRVSLAEKVTCCVLIAVTADSVITAAAVPSATVLHQSTSIA